MSWCRALLVARHQDLKLFARVWAELAARAAPNLTRLPRADTDAAQAAQGWPRQPRKKGLQGRDEGAVFAKAAARLLDRGGMDCGVAR